jgi:hypothetical protein
VGRDRVDEILLAHGYFLLEWLKPKRADVAESASIRGEIRERPERLLQRQQIAD